MIRNLWRYALLQRRVRGRGRPSAAHLLLCGVLGFVPRHDVDRDRAFAGDGVGTRRNQDPVFHKGLYYAIYEPVLELAGLALLAGCGFFAYRRWKRPSEMAIEPRDWLVLGLFALIGVTGYVLEGLRIVREDTPWPWLSFVGAAYAGGFKWDRVDRFSGRTSWHAATWWLHALLVFAVHRAASLHPPAARHRRHCAPGLGR
jgi:hypothetical protein